jgi:hypothetical protein
MTPTKSDIPQGTLDLLILKVIALGPVPDMRSLRIRSRAAWSTESQSWRRLTETVGLILRVSEGGAE